MQKPKPFALITALLLLAALLTACGQTPPAAAPTAAPAAEPTAAPAAAEPRGPAARDIQKLIDYIVTKLPAFAKPQKEKKRV